MKIVPKEKRPGMIQVTANMLFTFQDIQEACIKLGFDNMKLLEINKGVIQVFWDPPLLFAGQFARACNHRMFGPFYSEIDEQVVVGSFPMAEDVEFMKSKNIVGVVNMCHEWAGPQSQYTNVGIEQLRLQTVDTISPTLEKLEKGIRE